MSAAWRLSCGQLWSLGTTITSKLHPSCIRKRAQTRLIVNQGQTSISHHSFQRQPWCPGLPGHARQCSWWCSFQGHSCPVVPSRSGPAEGYCRSCASRATQPWFLGPQKPLPDNPCWLQTPLGVFQQIQSCSRCDGTGESSTPCSTCGGDGRVRRNKSIEVRVPAGE